MKPVAAEQSVSEGPTLSEIEDEHNVLELHASILREQAEPRDGFEPIPTWLTLVFGTIIFWGGFYLASYSGGFLPDVYDERRIGAVSSAGKTEAPVDPLVLGKRLYVANCAACHQPTGLGVSGQFPPLADSEWVLGDPTVLQLILLQGLQGPVSVKGQSYNGNMPAFGARLNDDQLAAVLSFIRQEWGNAADPILPTSVADIRKATSQRSNPWVAEELEAAASTLVTSEQQ
jgi:mono/diheme cytochrome c family protein